jgi:hypothetical protein
VKLVSGFRCIPRGDAKWGRLGCAFGFEVATAFQWQLRSPALAPWRVGPCQFGEQRLCLSSLHHLHFDNANYHDMQVQRSKKIKLDIRLT